MLQVLLFKGVVETKKDLSKAERAEVFLYPVAAALAPCIPLFFLYNKNVTEGILFSYCLLFGAALAVLSAGVQILLSLVFRTRGGALVFVTGFWAAFWYVSSLHGLLARLSERIQLQTTASLLLIVIAAAVIVLAYAKLPKAVGNVLALMLCLLFTFNFLPAAYAAVRARMALATVTDATPYELKTDFTKDSGLPHPNIYWMHMDGMLGFDAFERYFGDPQEELKHTLEEYGFVINEDARMATGVTRIAMTAIMAPTFYDSWLSAAVQAHADVSCMNRQVKIITDAKNQGFALDDDILPKTEFLEALSGVGYTISSTGTTHPIDRFEALDVLNDGKTITVLAASRRNAEKVYAQVGDFKELVVQASALKLFENSIDEWYKGKEIISENKAEDIPAYESTVKKYRIENSDCTALMEAQIRATKYATEMDGPHFALLNDQSLHFLYYKTTIGCVFQYDENGNRIDLAQVQREEHSNIYDLKRYFVPQYKYCVKQLRAALEVLIENDPDAVVVIQGDHGIHGLGPNGSSTGYFNEKAFEEQGYNKEDMWNLNESVISAVRIPEKYGKLTQPLEPLDISRYLVNHFVGGGNYNYLAYKD